MLIVFDRSALLCSQQIFEMQDSKKSTINAGVHHQDNILCGCGRYLISVNANTLEQQFIRPLSDKRADHRVIGLVISDEGLGREADTARGEQHSNCALTK